MLSGSRVDIASKTPGSMDIASGPKLWLNDGWYTGWDGIGICLPISADVWYVPLGRGALDPVDEDVCACGLCCIEDPTVMPTAVSSLLILFSAEAMTILSRPISK